MIIEPLVSETELAALKNEFKELQKSNIEIDINLLFVAKQENETIGFIEMVPISNKALFIRRFISKHQLITKDLLKDALMHAWEMDYCAVFTDNQSLVFYNEGFEAINNSDRHIPINSEQVLAYSLSYNGLKTVIKENKFQLN